MVRREGVIWAVTMRERRRFLYTFVSSTPSVAKRLRALEREYAVLCPTNQNFDAVNSAINENACRMIRCLELHIALQNASGVPSNSLRECIKHVPRSIHWRRRASMESLLVD